MNREILQFIGLTVYAATAPMSVITGIQYMPDDPFVGTVLIVVGVELLAVVVMLLVVEARRMERERKKALVKAKALEKEALEKALRVPDVELVTDEQISDVLRRQYYGHGSCRSDRDGDCRWMHCPQLKDGEPERSGRHCPLDNGDGE
jgi:mannitol-specific phosphotransferase system IIBC component